MHINNFGIPSVLLVGSECAIPTYFELILTSGVATPKIWGGRKVWGWAQCLILGE